MDYKDYYKILGVPRTAKEKDIKAAFRRLARKHHPDVNPGNARAEARFKEINEANDVLSDSAKRRRYDQMGANWDAFQRQGGNPWQGSRVHFNVGGREQEDLGGFSDFFRTFFSGGSPQGGGGFEEIFGRQARQERLDVETSVDLSLEEVLRGASRTLTIGGAGSRRTVEVKIPAGVREGSRVRVAGEGRCTGRGRRGDLYLSVRVTPHGRFERKGDDLHTTVSVPLTVAVLGGEAEVPTLEGKRQIKIPPGTPSGRVFRLRSLGLPSLEEKGRRGDVFATLNLEMPRKLSDREHELFEELRALGR